MSEYENVSKNLTDAYPEIESLAIIEGEKTIVYSTENWDVSVIINEINEAWTSKEYESFSAFDKKYIILHKSEERLVVGSFNLDERKRKLRLLETIIGFKDDERIILCRNTDQENIHQAFMDAARALSSLNSREPYLGPSIELGKAREVVHIGPKILFDTSFILQKLGLPRFGLTLDESTVYIELLKSGKYGDTVGSLNKRLLKTKRTTIYQILGRLFRKGWVEKEPTMQQVPAIKSTREAQKYIARPLTVILDMQIREKEEELKVLKSFVV